MMYVKLAIATSYFNNKLFLEQKHCGDNLLTQQNRFCSELASYRAFVIKVLGLIFFLELRYEVFTRTVTNSFY